MKLEVPRLISVPWAEDSVPEMLGSEAFLILELFLLWNICKDFAN
jgi:hypothetical protein